MVIRHAACAAALAVIVAGALGSARPATAGAAGAATNAALVEDWPEYLHDMARTGDTADNGLTAGNAPRLAMRSGWPVNLGNSILSTQPVVVDGVVYEGSWDGDEYAFTLSGALLWRTPLGTTNPHDATCGGTLGVTSTPAVAQVTVGSDTSPSSVLFLGGGGHDSAGGGSATVEALSASNGAVRWRVPVGPSPSTVVYSSPVVYTPVGAAGPSVYVGVSSYGDCPLVQGRVLQLDARDGAVQHVFDTVPHGCVGGGVWGSPTIDTSDGSVYVATGNGLRCGSPGAHDESVLKLSARTLRLISAWQVPPAQSSIDNDFGSTPTLFSGTVTPGGANRFLVGVGSKNGLFYVFNRSAIGAGPVAELRISVGGTRPQAGQGTISPAAWDGTRLYIGGGAPSAGSADKGVVRAWDPDDLAAPSWSRLLAGTVLGAVTACPGLVVFGEGSSIVVARATDGSVLRSLTWGSGVFYGAPSISAGAIYEGDTAGNLFAYAVTSG